MKLNKDFWKGVALAILSVSLIAATARQMTGPTSATVNKTLVRWNGTDAYKTLGSGVVLSDIDSMSGIRTIGYGQGAPTTLDLGTITGGSTATLLSTNSTYKATFSGATATIALPGSPADGTWLIHGTDSYTGGDQVITVPSLIRPEMDSQTAITTLTNSAPASSRLFTVAFTAIGGSFVKFSVIGDAYAP
jgi:hypothetical protein